MAHGYGTHSKLLAGFRKFSVFFAVYWLLLGNFQSLGSAVLAIPRCFCSFLMFFAFSCACHEARAISSWPSSLEEEGQQSPKGNEKNES